jgi:hypothetical protein
MAFVSYGFVFVFGPWLEPPPHGGGCAGHRPSQEPLLFLAVSLDWAFIFPFEALGELKSDAKRQKPLLDCFRGVRGCVFGALSLASWAQAEGSGRARAGRE